MKLEPHVPWYVEATSRFNALADILGIDENAKDELRGLTLELAKENFMAGNRSGIRWARTHESPARVDPCPDCFNTSGGHDRASCKD